MAIFSERLVGQGADRQATDLDKSLFPLLFSVKRRTGSFGQLRSLIEEN